MDFSYYFSKSSMKAFQKNQIRRSGEKGQPSMAVISSTRR